MTSRSGPEFRRIDATAAESAGIVLDVYVRSYVDAIGSGDPFDAPSTFMHRFQRYAGNPNFDMVVAYVDDEPVGQTWGWPLDPETAWWSGLRTDLGAEFSRETGFRTFALSEIMVVKESAGHGIAYALHNELLSPREEERATLLVEPDNDRAYRAYHRWGWRRVGELRPDWPDAPTFDVLILDLPLRASGD